MHNFHYGMHNFRHDRITALDLSLPKMEFTSKMMMRTTLANYQITKMPTTLHPNNHNHPPHLHR